MHYIFIPKRYKNVMHSETSKQSFWSKIAEVSNKKKKEEKEKNYEV